MKYYAVIDTNVLVSAMLKWESIPGSIMDLVFNDVIIPVLNEKILKEYREVLSRPKFHLTDDIVEDIISEIECRSIYVIEKHLDIELPDDKDRVFYEVTMEKRKTDDAYLTTGNIKHFPRETFILTPREFLDIISNGNLTNL